MPRIKQPVDTVETVAKVPRLQKRGHFTTIDLPGYIAPQVRDYLAAHPEQTFKQMVLHGLKQLGIQVNDEDLIAQRRRGLR